MAEYDRDSNYFGRRYIETSGQILGLCTPASRPAQLEQPKYPVSQPIPTNLSQENVNMIVSNLDEGEIMKGLHVNDALLPSRRHLIKEVSGLIDYSDNLIVSLASLRVIAQISHLHQYEPDPNLAGVAPNRLFSILQEEPGKLEQIRMNFRRRLEREEIENVQFLADGKDFPHLISTWLLLNAHGEEIERIMSPDFTEAFGLTNYIRLFIVNFFATNVSKKSYNLAHYILGFSQESHEINQDGCLSLLIDMLMYGLGHPSVEAPVIFIEHPALGVKLLNFLKSILLSPVQISSPAREYLRVDRELFYELAANINTRLLQVSFSTDKGYALSSEFETVRSSDFNFNVFELQQKSELFQILAIDLHEAFSSGQEGLYLEKILRTLLTTATMGGINSNEQSGVIGDSRIIDFLAAIDGITEDSYLKRLQSQNEGEFETALVNEFEASCASYIESLTMLMGEVLTILSESDEMSKEKESFVESLQSWLWKFMQKSLLSVSAIESLVQLNVLIGEEGFKTESRDSLNAQISVLLRPEINSTTRCFLYTALMNQNPRIIAQNLSEDRFLRLVELVTRDASSSAIGAVNDSLVTVALAILEFLNRARPGLLQDVLLSTTSVSKSFSYSIPTAINSTTPFIPGLLSSLTIDDSLACSIIFRPKSTSTSSDDLSVFLKWRAKWSLLLNLTIRENGLENDDLNEISSSFAHRFIDGGFLESVIFKFRCLSLNFSYRLADCGHLVLLTIFPVLKFLCALAMATGRQAAVASRLMNLFRSSDVFDAMSVLISTSTPESYGAIHAHVVHYILLLVNGVLQQNPVIPDDLNVKLVSFRHSILNQIVQKSRWIHQIARISAGTLTFSDDEITERLLTETQVLQELMEFLSRDDSEVFASNLTLDLVEERSNGSSSASLSLGSLIFILQICNSKLQEGRERSDLLNYFYKNLENFSPSDFELFNSENFELVQLKMNQIYSEIIEFQSHLVLLFEKTALLLLKHLRSKLASINNNFGSTSYIDSRSSQVQAARNLKTDASIIILPIIDTFHKNIRLVDSSANTSLYINTLVKDYFNLLSSSHQTKNNTFEL
jgi:hypothetical protein